MFKLIMQAPQHAFLRARVVVLHKLRLKPCGLGKVPGVEALVEKAALIAKNLRLDDQYTGQLSGGYIHSVSPASVYKY